MVDNIINFFLSTFSFLGDLPYGKELLVFIISIMPISELRGGLLAASILGLKPIPSYIISILGNLIPIPLVLLFFRGILDFLEKRNLFNGFSTYLHKKVEKNKQSIEKYGYFGLTLFVGIPLPGTGAFTGCLIASVLDMDKKKSFLAIVLGVLMASIIMMVISFGLLKAIF